MTDIAAIARGLSPAMRDAVTSAPDPRDDEAWGAQQTRLALVRRGICHDGVRNGWTFSRLTPLGKAVRNYLEGQGDGHAVRTHLQEQSNG